MSIYIRDGSDWNEISGLYLYDGSQWRESQFSCYNGNSWDLLWPDNTAFPANPPLTAP